MADVYRPKPSLTSNTVIRSTPQLRFMFAPSVFPDNFWSGFYHPGSICIFNLYLNFYVNISHCVYSFVSKCFCPVQWFWDLTKFLDLSVVCSFELMNRFLLFRCIIFWLSLPSLMDTRFVSNLGLLWIKLL